MPVFARTKVCLRLFGDTLDPDEVTSLLGVAPTRCGRKGDVRIGESGRRIVARSGSWLLETDVQGTLGERIAALLGALPEDPAIWHSLARRYRCDVFCGAFMREANEGVDLEPAVLSMLGDRGLSLGLDVYGPE
ncbi:DUF4279 domain-containing protein [uncultured Alsobacter sp.]|uniref:DUF4279 domain-containing protein n=1 Tax=uncultured Alsobacter sp. TaxID=1748258 RepID=UPI0025CD8E1D|nr:DUF4279 domain-containing protein [uncultured Alsobacter sp.]